MLRKLCVALVGVCALVPAADAADLGRSFKDTPVYIPTFTWNGRYLGLNVGYGWGGGHADVTPLPDAGTFGMLLPQRFHPDPNGALGGGQIGYNWQMGTFVFGVEADIQGAGISGTDGQSPIIQNNGTALPGNGNLTVKQDLDWFGTARVRAGITAWEPRTLLYATGGLAFGHLKESANADFWPFANQRYPASDSDTRTGWVIGGGLEWAWTDSWSFKAEYLHLDFGSNSMTANEAISSSTNQVTYDFDSRMDIVRAGINYRFR